MPVKVNFKNIIELIVMIDQEEIKECKKKFQEFLERISPQDIIKDDTFLEKIQTYLTFKGKAVLSFNFVILDSNLYIFSF